MISFSFVQTQAGGQTEADGLCDKYSTGLSQHTELGRAREALADAKLGPTFEQLEPLNDSCAAESPEFQSLGELITGKED